MRSDFSKIVWQGVGIEHPAEWELVSASKANEPNGCTFSDRRYERLKLMWRSLKQAPHLSKLLEDKKRAPDHKIVRLTGQPTGWHGTAETLDRAMIVHAGRYFGDDGLLLEAIFLWPEKKRDRVVENAVMAKIRPPSAVAKTDPGLWQAMGLRVQVGTTYDLLKSRWDSGQVAWGFGEAQRKNPKPVFGVRRIAMPGYWLKGPLEDWLKTQVGEAWRVSFVKRTQMHGHPAARMTSVSIPKARDRIVGRRLCRVDLAWECPTEGRVYHMQFEEKTAAAETRFPEDVEVACCAPYRTPVPPDRGPKRHGSDEEAASGTVEQLAAVPLVNQAAKLIEGSRGSLRAEIPLKRPWYLGGPVQWVFPVSEQRCVQLDVLGANVLDLCDGIRTVEQIVWEFATRNRLGFLEAQRSVMEYMRLLVRRGILVVAGIKGSEKRS